MNELEKIESQLDKKRVIEIINERLNLYSKRYSKSSQMLLHLIPFVVHFLTDKNEMKRAKTSDKKLKILIDIGEGLGGMVISLNWVCYFYDKFCKGQNIEVDCSSFNKKILDHFVPDFVHQTFSPETEKKDYDLKIFLVRCPQIVYADLEKINKISPAFCKAVIQYIVAENNYGVFFKLSYKRDAITCNIPSSNIKRWHQPDILDLFNMKEEFILPIKIPNENKTMEKHPNLWYNVSGRVRKVGYKCKQEN